MPLPQGYTIDQPQDAVKPPPGYTLDAQTQQAQPEQGWLSKTLSGTADWQQAIDKAATPGANGQVLQNLGAGAVGVMMEPIAHPLRTLGSLTGFSNVGKSTSDIYDAQHAAQQPPSPAEATAAIPGLALALTGAPEASDAAAAAGKVAKTTAGRAAVATGNVAQDAGTRLLNNTVGTLKADFKRGANPARGYLETGNGPSFSMASIADKALTALDDTREKLGTAYKQATDAGTKIPVDVVMQEMAKPIQKAINLETGPGGTGNLATINSYIQQFEPAFNKAIQNGGFTPSELFDIKRAIADNTNWSDPSQFNLKSVRQRQVGALSGILSDAIPETKGLNQNFMDLTKLSNRAQERADTGSRPLTAHIYKAMLPAFGALAGGVEGNALAGAAAGALLDSVPAKTALATGLYRGGRALSGLGDRLSAGTVVPEDVSPNDLGNNGANNKQGNPQLPPPDRSNSITPTRKWAAVGVQKVLAHIGDDPSSGVTSADVAAAVKSPQGQQLLLQASSLKPGSPMLDKIVRKIPATGDEIAPGDVGRAPVSSLNLDPGRFQYKLNTDAAGATNKLRDVAWNDALSGIVSAWRDPADGKVYVVNGHHRVDLAQRNGVSQMAVRMLPDEVQTPHDARVVGALQNIAEGHGTAVDAAKFMRDTSYTQADLSKYGVSMTGPVAEGGAALAKLDQKLFDDVAAGRIPERRGIAIGNAAETPEDQEALVKMIARAEARGRSVTNSTIEELGRMVKSSGQVSFTQDSLFGTETRTQNLALEKAEISAHLRNQISQERKLFGSLTSTDRAAKLSRVGDNRIDVKENAAVASEARQALEVYDRLSTRSGPIDDILNTAARRIAGGDNANAVKFDAYRNTRAALLEAIGSRQKEAGGSP